MKVPKQPRHGHLRLSLAFLAGALSVCAAGPARAALGGAPLNAPQGATAANAVVHAATAASGASGASAASNYTVRSTTLASGTVINEYVSSDGTVFGVAWRGPRVPDLATLLGSYFPQYQQAMLAQRAARGGRGQVSVQDSGLVVHSGGHMGAFSGSAYLPQSLPAGVSASDIQ
ncbi:DUF2844 domain-containing protein [Caballeronia sp. BCC1704]|uniref:DUF2844 domain-containing protein n=1 Tax=Caballeronia sp. BCC1704 TaxID=2676300 RepID=UPI00158F54DB|nr:DUF2844 domain-containing protein [Caballeronia sp. BCC1704]